MIDTQAVIILHINFTFSQLVHRDMTKDHGTLTRSDILYICIYIYIYIVDFTNDRTQAIII